MYTIFLQLLFFIFSVVVLKSIAINIRSYSLSTITYYFLLYLLNILFIFVLSFINIYNLIKKYISYIICIYTYEIIIYIIFLYIMIV